MTKTVMEKLLRFAVLAVICGLALPVYGQAFVDLDFESAQVVPVTGQFGAGVVAANALPGWTVFYQNQPQAEIAYNSFADVDFYGTSLQETNAAVIDGNFSLRMTYGGMISQTGVVPAGTESMFFSLAGAPTQLAISFLVSMDGQTLSYYAESNGINSDGNAYTVYAADVSAFSGQNVTLSFFTALRPEPIAEPNWALDDIGFSPLPVPEPGTFCLISFGAFAAGCHRWRKLETSS